MMKKVGWLRLAPAGGLLLAGGCAALAERNFDILLSPWAESNSLALSSSLVMPLLEFILRGLSGA